jgi:acyl carrier protein
MQHDSTLGRTVTSQLEGEQRLARLAALFEQHLNLTVPHEDTDLIDAGLLDSLMLVELLVHLEAQCGISIAVEDLELEHFRTLRSIAGFIERQQGR